MHDLSPLTSAQNNNLRKRIIHSICGGEDNIKFLTIKTKELTGTDTYAKRTVKYLEIEVKNEELTNYLPFYTHINQKRSWSNNNDKLISNWYPLARDQQKIMLFTPASSNNQILISIFIDSAVNKKFIDDFLTITNASKIQIKPKILHEKTINYAIIKAYEQLKWKTKDKIKSIEAKIDANKLQQHHLTKSIESYLKDITCKDEKAYNRTLPLAQYIINDMINSEKNNNFANKINNLVKKSANFSKRRKISNSK